ncbi:TlpA family protein disulfide reductase [Streptomyces lycii]|uniref:Thioredoxin domain-containing protein n=1 Tax=Streptomyces lycii TaxID=2654337 RepID=A0ABQ7FGS9_9ACTN|nr:hypothetical protein [Streptomyces lycii]KAF4408030.1 hypothetical protein GCU69_16825 [Streptomyces lycii]
MAFVIALTVLFGALSLFNIVLTVGLVRRIRGMDAGPSPVTAPPAGLPAVMRTAGGQVEAFESVTVRGETVSERFLSRGPVLAGVFAHGCSACHELLPGFLSLIESEGYSRDRVLVTLVGRPAELADDVRQLDPVATVVVEGRRGTVARALGVKAYPALAVIDAGGTVRASGPGIDSLSAAVTESV